MLLNEDEKVTSEMLLATLVDEHPCHLLDATTNTLQSTMLAQELSPFILSVAITSGNHLRPFKEIEQDVLLKAIEYCDGNVEKTAKLLKIGPATIHRKKQQWKSN